jgi:hypothetical protein
MSSVLCSKCQILASHFTKTEGKLGISVSLSMAFIAEARLTQGKSVFDV